jgi:putative ABC transport system permease protein
MIAFYRLLLLCFPRRVRREFGGDMQRMFEQHAGAARASGESLARLWLEAIADAVRHGMAERADDLFDRARALARGLTHWRLWMRTLRHDVRHAVRLSVRQPGVTVLVVLTLALGIGANTAIFSTVDAVLLRPLPYDEPDRLVMVWEKRAAEGVFDNVVAPADYVDWARMNTVFESIAALTSISADLTGSGEPVRLAAGAVTTRFFDVLRVRPQLGRTFRADDGVAGRHRVIVLGDGLWRRQFGADPTVVGRSILLNGVAHQVVGVLPRSFEFPNPDLELWAPLPFDGLSEPLSRASHELFVYARMKPGVTLDQARSEMDRLGAQLSAQYPDTNARHSSWVSSLRDQLTEGVRPALWLLVGAVAFVLLIACVNVANLLLVRSVGRRREIAVRAALGASRARLAGQLLTESLLLGLLGGAAGLIVAFWAIRAIRELLPVDAPVLGFAHITLDARVLGFTLVLSLATSVVFGLLPAWQLAGQDVNASLQEGGPRHVGAVRRRLRLTLVVSEIALASLLLVAAGLALRSFKARLDVPAGFTAEGRVTTQIVLRNARYREESVLVGSYEDIERRFAAMPGVRSVGATSALPLSGQDARRGIIVEGFVPPDETPTRAHVRAITPGYPRAMELQLAAGRGFSDADRASTPRVAIVNDTMARRYWPNGSPIGRRVMFTGTNDWREVVGVVRDVRHWGLARPVNPEIYVPLAQYPVSNLRFVIATDLDPASLGGPMREVLRAVDPDLPLATVRTMADIAAQSVAAHRAMMVTLAAFASMALLLAAAGIYGVMAHLVGLRTAEIGVRLALGADRGSVLRAILADGVRQAAVGLAIGLAAAAALVRLARGLLYGIQPGDPLTFGAVAVVMLAAAILACLVPALRAMRVDPVTALRQ